MAKEITQDIDAIRGYLKKNDKQLISQALNQLDVFNDKDIRVIRNLRNPTDLNKMTAQDGVRKLNTSIEDAKGKRKWTRRTITPRFGMKIFHVIPEELRETFMSEMLAPNATREPFAQWCWEQEFAKLAAEINDNFYYSEYADMPEGWDAARAYAIGEIVYHEKIAFECIAATAAGESPSSAAAKWQDVDNKILLDGFGTIIAKEILASKLTPTITDAFDETTAYDAFMEQWKPIPEAVKNKRLTAFVSMDTAQDLATNLNKKFGSGVGISNADIEEGQEFTLKGTGGRLRIKPRTWMNKSRRIIMTPPGNLTVGTDQVSDLNSAGKLVETLHGYKTISKFILAAEIADLEVLYVNGQE